VSYSFSFSFSYSSSEETEPIEWQWFAQTLNPYYEHDETTAAMLIDDDRLIFHTIHEDHWDFGVDNTGNLLNQENIDYYVSRFQPMGIDFVSTVILSKQEKLHFVIRSLMNCCLIYVGFGLDHSGW
jgi:hypothetical protein